MAFEINFTPTAADHVRAFRKFEQRIILDAIEKQLRHEATTETGKGWMKTSCPIGNCAYSDSGCSTTSSRMTITRS
jgi:hypothetical protein